MSFVSSHFLILLYSASVAWGKEQLSPALSAACDFKSHVFQQCGPRSDCSSSEQSDQGPRCFPVCKNRFEKFARIFSRRHKQTTFSDVGFLGILKVNLYSVYE